MNSKKKMFFLEIYRRDFFFNNFIYVFYKKYFFEVLVAVNSLIFFFTDVDFSKLFFSGFSRCGFYNKYFFEVSTDLVFNFFFVIINRRGFYIFFFKYQEILVLKIKNIFSKRR